MQGLVQIGRGLYWWLVEAQAAFDTQIEPLWGGVSFVRVIPNPYKHACVHTDAYALTELTAIFLREERHNETPIYHESYWRVSDKSRVILGSLER